MSPSPSASKRVLVLARAPEHDRCVALVRRAVEARGAELVGVDLARFPSELTLAMELDGPDACGSLGDVALDSFRSAWIRHLEPQGLPAGLAPDDHAACLAQSEAALWAVASCLGCYLLDAPEAVAAVPSKVRQQQLAARLGIDVPRTLVTNSPAAVRDFARRVPGGLVCKLIESGSVGVRRGDRTEAFPTAALDEADLAGDGLDGLALSPMIVQERLDKRLELRITVVGRAMFVAAVDPGDAVDARMDPALVRALRPFDGLPPWLEIKLFTLLDTLGLDFATLDVVLTRDGRWVLLEVNATSFFDHVEECAALPISGAIADLLLGVAAPRAPRPHRPARSP